MSDIIHPKGLPRLERLAERTIASNRILDLCGVVYRHPVRGTEREFICMKCADWVNVVAVTPDERILLVRQFRYGINDFSLEVPGGVIESGEDPVPAGVRELAEETGYVGDSARLLGSIHPNPAIQNNWCHAVLVEGATYRQKQKWDADEDLEVRTASVEEVKQWACSGLITHSLSLCAFMLFEAQRTRK